MKAILRFFCVVCLLLSVQTLPAIALAQESFHISYQLANVWSDGQSLRGDLLLHVMNVSGEDVRDLVVSVVGPNHVTYDNRTIFVGDLADAQPKGVLDVFSVPAELAESEVRQDTVTWRVEYTDSSGERTELDVTGERAPQP